MVAKSFPDSWENPHMNITLKGGILVPPHLYAKTSLLAARQYFRPATLQ